MRDMNMAAAQIEALASHGDKHFASAEAWATHLASLGFDQLATAPDPVKCGSACKRNPVSGVIGVQKGTTIPMV